MRRLFIVIIITACIVHANPIITEIVNEFQIAPASSEQVEFRYFAYPAQDTVINDTIPLINIPIITPPGTSFVDINLYLPGMGYVIINESILSGEFGLPDDSGFIDIPFFEIHPIDYPQDVPTPPIYCSTAKFHCWYWFQELPYTWYILMVDWYIDSTPTFGQPNDDYPGCLVAGHVYDYNGQPLSNARVTATAWESWSDGGGFINPPQYHTCCTTYTATDGSYLIDSLLPWQYYVSVYADGYIPDTKLTPYLRCTEPSTLDFHLLLGIAEDEHQQNIAQAYAFPNPFFTELNVVLGKPCPSIEIYDVTGKLCMRTENPHSHKHIDIDGSHLAAGIYFLSVPGQKIKIVKSR